VQVKEKIVNTAEEPMQKAQSPS